MFLDILFIFIRNLDKESLWPISLSLIQELCQNTQYTYEIISFAVDLLRSHPILKNELLSYFVANLADLAKVLKLSGVICCFLDTP